MAFREIEIPGGGTRFENKPAIQIVGGGDENVTIRVTYHAGFVEDRPVRMAELTFCKVLEFRFVDDMASYEEYDRHQADGLLGLIEVIDSEYVKKMLSRSPKATGPAGHRLADTIPDGSIHHYRLIFDEYGQLDIIALKIEVREFAQDC